MKCAVPDCQNEHRTKGYCNMHYERLRKKGYVNWEPPKPIERFMRFVKVNETGCWVWQGSKGNGVRNKGYGYFNSGEKNVIAHRWSYSFFKGAIPKGLTVHHKCYNPSCVNPEHLKAITQRENNFDSPRYVGNRTHCPRGHEYTPDNIYERPNKKGNKSWRECRQCSRERDHNVKKS